MSEGTHVGDGSKRRMALRGAPDDAETDAMWHGDGTKGARETLHRINDLPYVTEDDWYQLRDAAFKEGKTFDFVGYVKRVPDHEQMFVKEEPVFEDAIDTRDISKGEKKEGMRLLTKGYRNPKDRFKTQTGRDIREYSVVIDIPSMWLSEQGIFYKDNVRYDEDEISNFHEFYPDQTREYYLSSERSHPIVIDLPFEPRTDLLARQKAAIVHFRVLRRLEEGASIESVLALVESLTSILLDVDDKKVLDTYLSSSRKPEQVVSIV